MSISYLTSQKLDFKEPKEPNLPSNFVRNLKNMENNVLKMRPLDIKKEKAMNEARKKLEATKLEDQLHGKAKELAMRRRLEKSK